MPAAVVYAAPHLMMRHDASAQCRCVIDSRRIEYIVVLGWIWLQCARFSRKVIDLCPRSVLLLFTTDVIYMYIPTYYTRGQKRTVL